MNKICVLCHSKITPDPDGWAGGHNARPLAKGQCCGTCNMFLVEPAQIREGQEEFARRVNNA